MSDTRRTSGFTLLEVLIALAVVALAMLALTRTASLQVGDFDALRERTLAGWVAANVLTETRMAAPLPSTGRSDGRVEFASREWRWTRDVKATPDPVIRRIDVQVFLDDADAPSATLSGFNAAVLVQ
ncbi:MAG: type II secretion system minor pseudopilin GspI [Rhodanobacteraceae bacterium]